MSARHAAPNPQMPDNSIMNEFTFLADTFRDTTNPNLIDLAGRLAATPCSPLYARHISPDRELAALLERVSA